MYAQKTITSVTVEHPKSLLVYLHEEAIFEEYSCANIELSSFASAVLATLRSFPVEPFGLRKSFSFHVATSETVFVKPSDIRKVFISPSLVRHVRAAPGFQC